VAIVCVFSVCVFSLFRLSLALFLRTHSSGTPLGQTNGWIMARKISIQYATTRRFGYEALETGTSCSGTYGLRTHAVTVGETIWISL
jgi:hypothetical protein